MSAPADHAATHVKRLVETISPLIEQHLEEARRELRPRLVHVPDPDLIAAATRVAEAVGRLDHAKYTRGEIAARRSLEQQARALKTVLKRFAR
ncbi:hypothetical protein [Mesorhizobium sp. DCY119]|uniref:hypothetical protein n=1 Tax=Mesorhizobium sp. DCY119 TaxID=2108445 RepID=UPI000E6C7DF6|nr:hypothetical protein [Mesorhizobium sp. DCY119]RJG46467.1 hypothetical protein D3Y55_20955 [Mesorhizobium sp. DCY119]